MRCIEDTSKQQNIILSESVSVGLDSAVQCLVQAQERHQAAVRELKAFEDRLLPLREAHEKLQHELSQCTEVTSYLPAYGWLANCTIQRYLKKKLGSQRPSAS